MNATVFNPAQFSIPFSSQTAQVDAATGGLAVKIGFDAPIVVPVGMTVTANIIVDQLDATITIPRAAVVTDATGAEVAETGSHRGQVSGSYFHVIGAVA